MSTRRSYIVTAMGVVAVEEAMAIMDMQANAIRSVLRYAILQAAATQQASAEEQTAMEQARHEAERGLLRAQEIGREVALTAGLFQEAQQGSARLSDQVAEAQQRLKDIESKVAFVTRDTEMMVPAMATVMAMEANGYRLRETISREGLIAYFTSADASHEIAVRHQSARLADDANPRWEIEAETFQTKGEECLFLIEDFETAYEDLDLLSLSLAGPPLFPKRDGESRIPVPSKPVQETSTLRSTLRESA